MEALIDAMDKEKNERFQKSWPKLDKGSKLNRILIFILEEKERNILNETQTKQLKKLLFLQWEKGTLNKASDVEYSDETYHIVSIKSLEYDEEKEVYSFQLPKKQVKAVSKSKSNVERHFSRSKDNKK